MRIKDVFKEETEDWESASEAPDGKKRNRAKGKDKKPEPIWDGVHGRLLKHVPKQNRLCFNANDKPDIPDELADSFLYRPQTSENVPNRIPVRAS